MKVILEAEHVSSIMQLCQDSIDEDSDREFIEAKESIQEELNNDLGEPIRLEEGELATVLAALRFWQDNIGAEERAELIGFGHFTECNPLYSTQINQLCERINV